MKIITLLLSAFLCISGLNAQKKTSENQTSQRIEKIINSQWTFNYFPDESANKGYELPGTDDSKWPAISLPHTWNDFETTGELHPFIWNSVESDNPYWRMGWGWYRKHFSINRDYSDRKIFIEFKGVQKYCKVWLNGKYVGEANSGRKSFDFDITQFIKSGEDNLLAVAVKNPVTDESDKLPEGEINYNVYGGICNDVTIVLKNHLYIPMKRSESNYGVTLVITPQVTEKEGIVRIQTWVKNDNPQKKNCTLQTSISDTTNRIVQVIKSDAVIAPGQLYIFDQTFKPIRNPHLWSDKVPYLYKVYSEVIDGKTVTDAYASPQGLKFTSTGDTTRLVTDLRPINDLEEVLHKNMSENHVISAKSNLSNVPAKIILASSREKIMADLGSVVIISADIFDSKGNRINGATNTIKWSVSGPAKLIGPIIYESITNKRQQTDGVWYLNMPVSNVIRSTGRAGKIHVTVSASGLASGSLDIIADELEPDNTVITEPVLKDEGRLGVARLLLTANRLDDVPAEIKPALNEFNFGLSEKSGYARLMREYIKNNNSSVDTTSIEFKTLIELFAFQLMNSNGRLIADDYNFSVDHYNNCRLISGYINSTKLPALFKDGLKKFYSDAIIKKGSEKNAGDEMNWLNWIPSGGTVVIVQNENTYSDLKGAIFTRNSGLTEIISVVYPQFLNFSEEAKERALIFISKANPYVHVTTTDRQLSEGDNAKKTNVLYTAEIGQPILIPLLKFISE
jgi:hypothetical protein